MLSLLTALALPLLTSAQLFNTLATAPQCAQSCPALTSVQSSCVSSNPGAAPAAIASCFCTNPSIAGFPNDGNVCGTTCTDPTSQGQAMQWFAAYCANPATIVGEPAATTSAPIPSTTLMSQPAISTPTSGTDTATSTPTGDPNVDNVYWPETGTWWDRHARWIAMAIVLVVGFAIIITVGILWKKRYDKKHNTGDRLAPGATWGPTQHHHHPNISREANVMAADEEKGRASNMISSAAARSPSSTRNGRGVSKRGKRFT